MQWQSRALYYCLISSPSNLALCLNILNTFRMHELNVCILCMERTLKDSEIMMTNHVWGVWNALVLPVEPVLIFSIISNEVQPHISSINEPSVVN